MHKLVGVSTAFLGTAFASAHADWALNMRQGVTETSQSVYELHMIIFWVCCAIGVVVFGAMVYSIIYHRKSKGASAAQFHESTTMEILWTVVPIVILVSMAIPATRTLLAMEDTSNADMTIKVTGIQWKWKYDYVDGDAAGVSFVSSLHPKHNEARLLGADVDLSQFGDNYLMEVDNPLVIPTGQKVRFLLTAADVIHAWWVPDLGWKKDAIPGFVNEAWTQVDEPGVYRGKCAELCGKDHGFMPIVVEAVAQDEYAAWVEKDIELARIMAARMRRHPDFRILGPNTLGICNFRWEPRDETGRLRFDDERNDDLLPDGEVALVARRGQHGNVDREAGEEGHDVAETESDQNADWHPSRPK